MTAFDVDMRETASELIGEFGCAITWTNITAVAASPSNGTATETSHDYTVTVIRGEYDPATGRTGSQWSAGDLAPEGYRQVTLAALDAADAGFTPTTRDRVTIDGAVWQVVALQVVQPGELPIVFTAQLRM